MARARRMTSVVAALACLCAPALLSAQRAQPVGAIRPVSIDAASRSDDPQSTVVDSVTRPSRWWTPLASAVLPGSGQLALRQTRAAGYLALDVFEWLQFREARADQRRARAEYQRVARDVARQPCATPCPDGNWDYYEKLEDPKWVGSGRFDVVPGGRVDPETSDSTYNGFVWGLARDLYFPSGVRTLPVTDPAYARALAYYSQRAYGPQFEWSWRDRQQMRSEYRQTVARRNSANRTATNALSVMMANRVFSLVDAYVTLRVHRVRAGGPTEFSATLPWERVPGLTRRRP